MISDRGGDRLDQITDELAGIRAAIGGLGREDEAMGDDIHGYGLDHFRGDELPALEECHDLGNFHEGERGAGAGRELDLGVATGGGDQCDGVVAQLIAETDAAGGVGDGENFLTGQDRAHGGERMGFTLIGENSRFFGSADVAHAAAHGEAVHLGFRQGVGATEFDGILGGDDEKEAVEIVAGALDGDLALAHGLEQGALGAGRGAVDLIREEDIGENRAGMEAELAGGRIEDGDAQDIGGQEIGGELDAFEDRAADGPGDCFGEGCFPCSGEILEQDMTAGKHAGENPANRFLLASHDGADGHLQIVRKFRFPHSVRGPSGLGGMVSTSNLHGLAFRFVRRGGEGEGRDMSIMTKRGDGGMTDLLFGKRISKTSVRVGALGALDELNTAIGLARAAGDGKYSRELEEVQGKLFPLMGELACLPDDREKYEAGKYGKIGPEDLEWLVETASRIEAGMPEPTHWAVPGGEGRPRIAHLDHARSVARRAEREMLLVHEKEGGISGEVRVFLNRLSDFLWIVARSEGAGGGCERGMD